MAEPMPANSCKYEEENITSTDDQGRKAFCSAQSELSHDCNSVNESETTESSVDCEIGCDKKDVHGPRPKNDNQQAQLRKIDNSVKGFADDQKAWCEDTQQKGHLKYQGARCFEGENHAKRRVNDISYQDSEATDDRSVPNLRDLAKAKCMEVREYDYIEYPWNKLRFFTTVSNGASVKGKDLEFDGCCEKGSKHIKHPPEGILLDSRESCSDEIGFRHKLRGNIIIDGETHHRNFLESRTRAGSFVLIDRYRESGTSLACDHITERKETDWPEFRQGTHSSNEIIEGKQKLQKRHCNTLFRNFLYKLCANILTTMCSKDVETSPEAVKLLIQNYLNPYGLSYVNAHLLVIGFASYETMDFGVIHGSCEGRKDETHQENWNFLHSTCKRQQKADQDRNFLKRLKYCFVTHTKKKTKRKKIVKTVVLFFRDVGGRTNESKTIHEERNRFVEIPSFVDVEGNISDTAVDPPGQQSSYIPPGDIRYESYRVSTFENYPKDSVVDIRTLAENGFHYTGFFDRVKCYSCGRTVERWERGDDPKDKQYHRADCEFANGRARDNVPIVSRFQARLTPQIRGLPRQNVSAPARRSPNDNPDQFRQGDVQYQSGGITITSGRQNSSVTPSGRSNREWRLANVISADHRRFLSNLFLNREIDRLASFSRWSTGRLNVSPVSLSKAGFFYLGDMDRTQCFSCGGVLRNWTVHDNAMNEHRANFPTCHFTQGTDNRNVPVPDVQETPQELREAYPCQYPYNPHMRNQSMREDSFDHRWPAGRIQASPQEIAAAGFFFLGERDKVKCWYCNGGLQNWEVDDSPWIEHSKWFPNCQFLLQQRGQFYVFRHLSLNAHLPRPIIRRQDGAILGENARSQRRSAEVQDVPPQTGAGFSRVTAPSPPPTIIDPQEERRKQKERVEKELKESEIVKNVMAFGYGPEIVKKVLEEKLAAGEAADSENIFDGVMSLLDAVQNQEKAFEEEQRATDVKMPAGASNFMEPTPSTSGMETPAPSMGSLPPSGVAQVSGFNVDSEDEDMDLYGSLPSGQTEEAAAGPSQPEPRPGVFNIPQDQGSIKDMYEQQMDERLCKICFDNIADMVFVPCGHIACCLQCTQAIRQCPACRVRIEKAIRISMP